MPKKKEITEVDLHEFDIVDGMPISCGFLTVAPPGSGKSTLCGNLAFYRKHQYPVAKLFIGTEDDYKKHKETFHPLFVNYGYSDDQLEDVIKRARSQAMKYETKGQMERRMILWMDDLGKKEWHNKFLADIVKLGSQHWDIFGLFCSQSIMDFPVDFRNSISFVALGRNMEAQERKKMYECFGAVCGNKNRFNDVMDQIAEKKTFVIIKRRTDSNEIEDCVFWYQGKILPPWKFGCKEWRQWGDARYDVSYKEFQ